MTRYLLAAEADKIQEFVFRASRLREVVGGSQLLSRFCEQGALALLKAHGGTEEDIVINDGGAFRIWFADPEKARAFGRDLAELYRRTLGGSISVGEPVSDKGGFRSASKSAHQRLREAKSAKARPATSAHLPYVSFCASCGVAVASVYDQRADEERAMHLCADCQNKSRERHSKRGDFIGRFMEEVSAAQVSNDNDTGAKSAQTSKPTSIDLELPSGGEWQEPMGKLDLSGRRYVAYLLADGNGMGMQFEACKSPDIMKELSRSLTRVLTESLAAPCVDLIARLSERGNEKMLPVLPLILGGDDLFALIPASWAIDFAARFCKAYEEKMAVSLKELGLLDKSHPPTISAAVVICKANYPHTLAHKRGERLLKRAKALARRLEAHDIAAKRGSASVMDFEFIAGNETTSSAVSEERMYRATARPYFVREIVSLGEVGLPIRKLTSHRLFLAKEDIPQKRRAELSALFDEAVSLDDGDGSVKRWNDRLRTLLGRIGSDPDSLRKSIDEALVDLGMPPSNDIGVWRRFERYSPAEEESFCGNGLADLLSIWDFAYDLSKEIKDYNG